MESSARQVNMRGIIIYSVVALVLLGAVIGVVVWAKDRARQYAGNQSAPTEQTVTPEVQGEQEQAAPAPSPEPSSQEASPPAPSTAPGTATPSHVPATGASDWVLLVATVSLTGFVAAQYVQSRRRLLASR